MSSLRVLASAAVSMFALVGCTADPEVRGDEQNVTSNEITAAKAIARFVEVAPYGRYVGTNPNGFSCVIEIVQPKNIPAPGAYVTTAFYSGDYCADCNVSPVWGTNFSMQPEMPELNSADPQRGHETPVSNWKDDEKALSFTVKWDGYNTVNVETSDLTKPGASFKGTYTVPDANQKDVLVECNDMKPVDR